MKIHRTNEQPAKQTTQPRIAVLIPCREEAVAVAAVVGEFRAALPEATIYVYDNGSTDETDSIARAAGAVVRREDVPGKGNVVRWMFADIDADDTYDAGLTTRARHRT